MIEPAAPVTDPAKTAGAPAVSVIVPCYNKSPFVAATLDSVLAQTGIDFEVIVVDDHSSDDSWSVIQQYADRVSVHRLPENRGSTASRRAGAELARGGALMFLDGDDLLTPGTLMALHDALLANPGNIAACRWRKLHPTDNGWETGPSPHALEPPGGDLLSAWLGGWYFPPCSILWPRDVYEASGGWREMGPWDDAEIMMRAFLAGAGICVATGGESLYRILDEGESLRSEPSEPAVRSRIGVLDTVSRVARERGLLQRYRRDLGLAYYRLGTRNARSYPHLVLECFGRVDELLGRDPVDGSRFHRVLWKVLGIQRKQRWTYRLRDRGPRLAVDTLGLHPRRVGYRWWKKESIRQHLTRTGRIDTDFRVVHPPERAVNPLPRNVASAEELPAIRGWWGFSFRDVPDRLGGETFIATVRDVLLVPYVAGPEHRFAGDYYVGLLTADGRSLEMREVKFREGHARILREGRHPLQRLARATWIAERVYDNHSHWLTAHVAKLDLLKREDLLGDLVLPARLTPTITATLSMMGLDAADFRTVDSDSILHVDELTVVGSDRFRPELLRSARAALARVHSAPDRRIYISRSRAGRRRLLNEEELWPMLEAEGFERVFMEDLSFDDQVALMGETAVLVAPHGAGLTNMLFCAEGTHVVEIADLSFPNPNFYAIASALGLHYWLVRAESTGSGHPLERDMITNADAVMDVVRSIA